MYPNLEAEIARLKVSDKDIAEAISKDLRTVRNKKEGITQITIAEGRMIRDTFFPDLTLDYLFEEEGGNDKDRSKKSN